MSEYQYVCFRAVNAPVTKQNLEYMEQQSSRAKITTWSFENEYNFGEFHGNSSEMLRRGYDFHLHFANYGTRKLQIRLPNGFPNQEIAQMFFSKEGLIYESDKNGPGGILTFEPGYESTTPTEIYDVAEYVDQLVPIRAEILAGDLRPLYLLRLAALSDDYHDRDDEEAEGPVPAGLEKLTDAQIALIDYSGLRDALFTASCKGAPCLALQRDLQHDRLKWLEQQSSSLKNAWLHQLMMEPHSPVIREIQLAFQRSLKTELWATINRGWTITELETAATAIEDAEKIADARRIAIEKAKRLTRIAGNADQILRETETLVKNKARGNYEKVAKLLSELREALTDTDRPHLAEEHADKLKSQNPTLKSLISALRKEGFLSK